MTKIKQINDIGSAIDQMALEQNSEISEPMISNQAKEEEEFSEPFLFLSFQTKKWQAEIKDRENPKAFFYFVLGQSLIFY